MAEMSLKYLLFGEDRTASKAIQNVGHEAQGVTSKLSGMTSRLGSLFGGEVGELAGKVSEGLEAAGEAHKKLSGRMIATGSVATGVGVLMQNMASGDVEAQNQLQAAVDATGKGYDSFGEDVDSLVKKQEAFGNTDGDVKTALRGLVQAYGDPKKALEQMNLVTDLAAAKHISLADAATLVGKAHNGSAKIFKEFGVTVQKNKDGTMNYDAALGVLSKKVSGQASASMDSFGGKLKQVRATVDNVASGFAEKYGPAITTAGAAVTALGVITDSAGLKTAALAVKTNIVSAATKIWAGVQWLMNAALDANPIGIVIVAIAALAAGIIYAYRNSETFRNIVDGAFRAIASIARWFWNSVMAPVIRFLIGGFAAVADWIGNMLDALSHIPGFGWAKDAANKMHGAAGAARNLASNIRDIPENVNVTVNIRTAGLAAAAQARNVISQLKDMRGFASGGTNIPAGLAWVGENGPELMYVPGGSTIYDAQTSAQMARPRGGSRSAAGGGSDQPLIVQLVLDGRVVQQSLLRLKRTQGGAALGLG